MKNDIYKKGLVLLCLIIIAIITIVGYYISKEEQQVESISNSEIEEKNIEDSENTEKQKQTIKVDIGGAIKNPGVYELKYGSRVDDLILMAGGITENANSDYISQNINKAKVLEDEDKVYLPNMDDDVDQIKFIENNSKTNDNCEDNKSITNKIDINIASKEKLMTLNGIGQSYADRIIEYRNKHKFNSIEEIMNVSGIGEKRFANIKDFIKVD
ncbi:helix-hairpin-helix domain-containing protein [Sedimentibacter sp. zth1]|uniref:helix-hairpin-helix domain-containing protein n=1 Tax=Sedimentibacter sp. zth1 TaxID=2816908 RepID=UPI001A933C76|nr:helix-hairpin-helix domain-containing protein [Sedimentibacter sp. zth1]QSX06966.1 helix-hairpin-helix domain-containing protein [Sedimentibacter sp. zth1]